jgi:hypothetical protein
MLFFAPGREISRQIFELLAEKFHTIALMVKVKNSLIKIKKFQKLAKILQNLIFFAKNFKVLGQFSPFF